VASPRTVQLIHTTLHKALKQVVRWGLIVRNVAEVVQAPRWARKELRVLSPEEVGRLLKASRGERLAYLYLLAVTTGLREDELLGLRWRDVNLEAEVLSVSQQLARTKAGLSFTSPKRGKARSVGLHPLPWQH
jgi:integrase